MTDLVRAGYLSWPQWVTPGLPVVRKHCEANDTRQAVDDEHEGHVEVNWSETHQQWLRL